MTDQGDSGDKNGGAQPSGPADTEKQSKLDAFSEWWTNACVRKRYPGAWAPRPEDRLPPQLPRWKCVTLWFADFVLVLSVAFLSYVCVESIAWSNRLPACSCWIYLALVALLLAIIVDRRLRHLAKVHSARLEDRAEVEKLISKANDVIVKRALTARDPNVRTIRRIIQHLDDIDPQAWVEYEILPLRQALVDVLPSDDLVAQAQSTLLYLKDFAEDTSYRYDKDLYYEWGAKIQIATRDVEELGTRADAKQPHKKVKKLRAELKMLHEHVADYETTWAEGSAMIRELFIVGSVSFPAFFVMGILPILNLGQRVPLGYLNWGFLGVAGALLASLLTLRRADVVEVGNTEGRKEIWRSVTGAVLGFASGVLVLAAIYAKVLPDQIVPNPYSVEPEDIGLSILWAMSAGFLLDRFFERTWGPWQGTTTS